MMEALHSEFNVAYANPNWVAAIDLSQKLPLMRSASVDGTNFMDDAWKPSISLMNAAALHLHSAGSMYICVIR